MATLPSYANKRGSLWFSHSFAERREITHRNTAGRLAYVTSIASLMPTKTTLLEHDHFVLNPRLPSPEDCLRRIRRGKRLPDAFGKQEDLGTATRIKVLIPLLEFFLRHSPIRNPFHVLWSGLVKRKHVLGKLHEFRLPLRVTQKFQSQKQLERLNAALNEDCPMLWNHYARTFKRQQYYTIQRQPMQDENFYLFGKTVWRLIGSEKNLTQDQLRLVFLDTIDKEREKFERLKRKFTGTAGERVPPKRELTAR